MKSKPLIVVVTGRPASGKSTLAYKLQTEIKCPLISRDELKEGYVNASGIQHDRLDESIALHIYESFFETIDLLISRNISIIAEAAFQHKLWKPKLLKLLNKAEIKIIVCDTSVNVARKRFIERLTNDPSRNKFHGDRSLLSLTEPNELLTELYEPVNMDLSTFVVDTTEEYNPGFEKIVEFIKPTTFGKN